MGSGCSGRRSLECSGLLLGPAPATKEALPALQARLAPVFQAAGRAKALPDARLDEVIGALAAVDPEDGAAVLQHCLTHAPAKSRAALLQLLQRVFASALGGNVALAEELAASEEPGEGFARLAAACEGALRLDEAQSRALRVAAAGMEGAARALGREESKAAWRVPALEALASLFRAALLGGGAAALQQWRALEESMRLFRLEAHPSLLGPGAKALFLALRLVPEGAPPAALVVRREQALSDAGGQLPATPAALLPYFESAAGSKVVSGKRVEGGEGHGPRKEFFAAASAEALQRWRPVEEVLGDGEAARCEGRSIRVEEGEAFGRCFAKAKVGDRVALELADGTEAERVVVAVEEVRLVVGEAFQGEVVARGCVLKRPVAPLFEFHRGTGEQWPSVVNGGDGRFRSFGKLLALALANSCKISFLLPLLFFRLLLGKEPAQSDLRGFDEALHASMRKVLKMRGSQFAALREVESLPSETTREAYVAEQVRAILLPVGMEELRRGFWSLMPEELLQGVAASDLRQMLCPTEVQNLDIRRIFRVFMEEEMAGCAAFVDAFWAVLESLSLEEKKLFLLFVTGLEAPPEAGVESLRVELPFSAFSKEEQLALLQRLPQAHTCSNTLELPNYHDALLEAGVVKEEEGPEVLSKELRRVLGEKLRLAIREAAGYDLDALSPPSSPSSPSSPARTAEDLRTPTPPAVPLQPVPAASADVGSLPPAREECGQAPAASTPAMADVDSLLQECGLLSLLSEEVAEEQPKAAAELTTTGDLLDVVLDLEDSAG